MKMTLGIRSVTHIYGIMEGMRISFQSTHSLGRNSIRLTRLDWQTYECDTCKRDSASNQLAFLQTHEKKGEKNFGKNQQLEFWFVTL